MKPYIEDKIDEKTVIRTFSRNVKDSEMEWHWDNEDRLVFPLQKNDWLFQFDNQLPIPIDKEIFIPKGTIHRAIKGNTDLIIKIIFLFQ